MTGMRARAMLLGLLVPLALLSACGDGSSSTATDPGGTSSSPTTSTSSSDPASESTPADPSSSATPVPDWPACGDVWTAGATIPLAYKGCLKGGQPVQADNLGCSSGQKLVRYADRFYGVAGGTIYQANPPLNSDKGYLKMVRTCRA